MLAAESTVIPRLWQQLPLHREVTGIALAACRGGASARMWIMGYNIFYIIGVIVVIVVVLKLLGLY
jgi:hypothetical protein